MPRPRFNLKGPLARWEAYAMALLFIAVVWQFGNYLDHRREVSDHRAQVANSKLTAANAKLVRTAERQHDLNSANTHLRNAVCIIFDGTPAPPRDTRFGRLWHHARKEAQCGTKPKVPKHHQVPPSTTPTYIPSPFATPHPTKSPHHNHPKGHGPRHSSTPVPSKTCLATLPAPASRPICVPRATASPLL